MSMILIIAVLFVVVIVSPFVFPNKLVSNDKEDIEG
jgi:hypothetical protein